MYDQNLVKTVNDFVKKHLETSRRIQIQGRPQIQGLYTLTPATVRTKSQRHHWSSDATWNPSRSNATAQETPRASQRVPNRRPGVSDI